MSVHAVTDQASSPLSWRLFVPPDWDDRGDDRRRRTGLPSEVGHVEKWRLAIDMPEEVISRGGRRSSHPTRTPDAAAGRGR
ncbi:transposase [Streptomyces sp. NPDC006692]|uniref:transposase n=1 Tax=Streptomyces sp. NPDC006692 TaxID=3364758 RepID=UPI00368B9834